MREITFHELVTLIKNEISTLHTNTAIHGFNIGFVKRHAQKILEYVEEIEHLPSDD